MFFKTCFNSKNQLHFSTRIFDQLMKGTIRLSLDPISTLVYVTLLILTIYNIRLSWNLAKLKSSVAVKPFESLSSLELNEIEKINHDRRKWSIVGNIFFVLSLALAFVGTLNQLAYFLTLYTVCNIIVVKYNTQTFNVIRADRHN